MAKRDGFKPWSLPKALQIIREMQDGIHELGYHVCLGGGVLNKGVSEKDLDLFILPKHGYEKNADMVMRYIRANLGPTSAIRDSPDYGPDAMFWAEKAEMVDYLGYRIDIFIY